MKATLPRCFYTDVSKRGAGSPACSALFASYRLVGYFRPAKGFNTLKRPMDLLLCCAHAAHYATWHPVGTATQPVPITAPVPRVRRQEFR